MITTELNFSLIKQAVQRQFKKMNSSIIFCAAIDKDEIWKIYLESFPEGTNPRFRERTEHDCSCCRSFIKNAGGMVSIENGKIITLWDIQVEGYQPVVDALSTYVRSKDIANVFLYPEKTIGTDKNFEQIISGITTWEHFHLTLPNSLYAVKDTIGPHSSEYRALHDVVLRSLQEITLDALETVQDLIAQNSLYRGAEKKTLVTTFAKMKKEFDQIPETTFEGLVQRDLYAWSQIIGPNSFVCRMRNDVIGTLLVDISEGVDLEKAVKSFEDKVSGTNYKRPTSLITPKMRDLAKAKLVELGLIESLERRYAFLEDIKITNVLFANRDAKTHMSGNVFDNLPVKTSNKSFDKVEEVHINKFISDILPNTKSLEVMFENKHSSNLVSLIAPHDITAKTLFKWPNPFSWSYNGDVADSIKEKVKNAGGNVTGDICCRLAWYNHDDLDFHMKEPNFHIYYGGKYSRKTGGQLDIDMNASSCSSRTPVENIFYSRKSDLSHGTYELSVNQFRRREGIDVGFEVEIDILGTLYSFSYDKPVSGTIKVADLEVSSSGIKLIPILKSSQATRELWNIKTQEFHAVTAIMLSPNFWDDNKIGNLHYFFMLDKCRNDGSARGFYNEFLNSELETHRKTMELVGSKMRTDNAEDQLSGLGFSSTQRNSLVVKVSSSFERLLKITF